MLQNARRKHDDGDILRRGLVGERLRVFVLRKLDVRLWTEHTVSVSDSNRAQPQGGIKSVVLSRPVLWRKRGRGFRLNGLIEFFLYSHQFLVVQEAQEVPEEKGRISENGGLVIHLPDRCVYLARQKFIWSDFKMTASPGRLLLV